MGGVSGAGRGGEGSGWGKEEGQVAVRGLAWPGRAGRGGDGGRKGWDRDTSKAGPMRPPPHPERQRRLADSNWATLRPYALARRGDRGRSRSFGSPRRPRPRERGATYGVGQGAQPGAGRGAQSSSRSFGRTSRPDDGGGLERVGPWCARRSGDGRGRRARGRRGRGRGLAGEPARAPTARAGITARAARAAPQEPGLGPRASGHSRVARSLFEAPRHLARALLAVAERAGAAADADRSFQDLRGPRPLPSTSPPLAIG